MLTPPPSPPPRHKGEEGVRFFKNGYGEFLESLYIIIRRMLTPQLPYFMKTPHYIVYPLFSSAHLRQPPTFLSSPAPLPLLFLSLWLNGWSRHIWLAILLNNMDLHMSSLCTLVQEKPWCMQQGVKFTEVWHIMWFFGGTLIDITHKQTHKHTQHTQGWIPWQNHINIYLHHLLRGHSNYLYCIKWLNE